MVDKLPKYRRGIGTGRTIAPKSGVPARVAMLPHHNRRMFRLAPFSHLGDISEPLCSRKWNLAFRKRGVAAIFYELVSVSAVISVIIEVFGAFNVESLRAKFTMR